MASTIHSHSSRKRCYLHIPHICVRPSSRIAAQLFIMTMDDRRRTTTLSYNRYIGTSLSLGFTTDFVVQ